MHLLKGIWNCSYHGYSNLGKEKVSGWWILDKFQYENNLNDQLLNFAHTFLTGCCTKLCLHFF